MQLDTGEGVVQNSVAAVAAFRKVAERGHPHAMFELALCLLAGDGVAASLTEAVTLLKEAADNGFASAVRLEQELASTLAQRVSDTEKRARLLQLVAETGDPRYQLKLAVCLAAGGDGTPPDLDAARSWILKAAEAGNANAMGLMGFLSASANDHRVATEWYRKAAEAGNAESMGQLGIIHLVNDRGVSRNYEEAYRWFRQAAEMGHPASMHLIGTMYQLHQVSGSPPEQDAVLCVEWYRKAAAEGQVDSVRMLGAFWARGDLGLHYVPELMTWMRKAADKGDAECANYLSDMHLKLSGELRLRAAELGWVTAMVEMGTTCTRAARHKEAHEWYRKAAMEGDPQAMLFLADMYSAGRGVAVDVVTAYAYCVCSSELGHAEARRLRQIAERELSQRQIELGMKIARGWLNDIESNKGSK